MVSLPLEFFILIFVVTVGGIGNLLIMRRNWKRYFILFFSSAIVGLILCYLFIFFGFYVYPYRLFPEISTMPLLSIGIGVPFAVLIAVFFSPQKWVWKIPFYWAIIHAIMLFETVLLIRTDIIEYVFKWDFWDSYTWWWIYLLVFEYIGGLIIPEKDRRPIDDINLRYGKVGWFIIHFILIVTIFLGGFYLGRITNW